MSRLDEIKIEIPNGQILRYVASFENGEIKVGLKSFSPDSPMAGLQYADNILIVKSERYHTRPLVIQGPGAGPSVTAGGVFSDLLRLMNSLGASL
jgi:aspartokinase/homoserine dehydrogenase 1